MIETPNVDWKYPEVFNGYKTIGEKLEYSTAHFAFLRIELNGEQFEGYFCKSCLLNARVNEMSNRVFCMSCTDPDDNPIQDLIPSTVGSFRE